MKYRFTASAPDGRNVRGVVDTGGRYDALVQIREDGLIVRKLVPVRKISELLGTEIGPGQLSFRVLSVLCAQLSVLLKSGIPVTTCVSLLCGQTDNKKVRKILRDTGRLVEAGNLLSDSFYLADRNAFPVTFLETVRAGEKSGTLDKAFGSLSGYYEKRYKMRQKVSAAMTYPGFVLAIALIVIGMVTVMVVPTMAEVFAELGAELPLPTRILIGISRGISGHLIDMAVVILGCMVLLMSYARTEKGRLRYYRGKLRIPVLGKLWLLEASGHFAHTMSVMLHSGLSLTQALMVTSRTLENFMLASAVARMSGKVVEGRRLGDCMREEACFPDTLNEVCAMGEETGELEELLSSMGEYFDSQGDLAAKKAITMLEPVLLVILAVFTGFIVISIYLPLFTMYQLM